MNDELVFGPVLLKGVERVAVAALTDYLERAPGHPAVDVDLEFDVTSCIRKNPSIIYLILAL